MTPVASSRGNPRFQGENLSHNLELFERLTALAAEKAVTPAQLALAWLLAQGPDVVPIPGTKSMARLVENAAATAVGLSGDEVARIDHALPPGLAAGERYAAASMAHVER
jgi:aryl-alcohol dehydrogenase-like predicted oxidoreductase